MQNYLFHKVKGSSLINLFKKELHFFNKLVPNLKFLQGKNLKLRTSLLRKCRNNEFAVTVFISDLLFVKDSNIS